MDQRAIEIFNQNVIKNEGCWGWTGGTDKVGSAIIRRQGTEYVARRVSLALAGHPIEEISSHIFATCLNKLCSNPEHLFFGDAARFWSKIDRSNLDGCWLWTAAKDKDEYGKFRLQIDGKGIDIRAHVFSYELHFGKITDDSMCVCHTCDVPSCTRPSHLFLGTNQENNADKVAKGRQIRGEAHPDAKLTEADVVEIRKSGLSPDTLANLYSVTSTTIRAVLSRKTWKHVP